MTKTGQILRRLRIEQHMSQKSISERLFLPLGTYRSWEYGKCLPNYENIENILNFYYNSDLKDMLYNTWVEERENKLK